MPRHLGGQSPWANPKYNDRRKGASEILSQYRGLKTVEHSGVDATFRRNDVRFPQQQLSIVILANISRCDPVRLAQKIADSTPSSGKPWHLANSLG